MQDTVLKTLGNGTVKYAQGPQCLQFPSISVSGSNSTQSKVGNGDGSGGAKKSSAQGLLFHTGTSTSVVSLLSALVYFCVVWI